MKFRDGLVALAALSAIAIIGVKAAAEDRETARPLLQLAQNQWGQRVEDTFWLGRGMGQRLMTQEEWLEHQQKMQSLTPQERQSYREEIHQKMVERARERGIETPGAPGPHRGYGPGGGMGPRGGMGPGGMGRGGRR